MITVNHIITKRVKGDGQAYSLLFWLELSHRQAKSLKGKISFELSGKKYREEFRLERLDPKDLSTDRRTVYVGVPCQEKPKPGSKLKVTLKFDGKKEEVNITLVDKYEDLSMY